MRLNRFFGNFNFQQKSLRLSDRDFLHQTKDVLRLKKGERVVLVNEDGQEAMAEITDYEKNAVSAEILEIKDNQNEPSRRVILYCSILKRENFELVAQKAVEVGVAEIAPIICEYTVKTGLKYERLRKIIKEAAEQSGRGFVPILREAASFKEAAESAAENSVNFLFDQDGANFATSAVTKLAPGKKIGIFIGSEGGWSDFEMDLARQRQFKIVSLGKLTLRAETAAIVAAYLASRS